ncbi:hypothetical protein L293_4006 [Acinetobacter gyllenbergii CIP 110306 = MTCC 11365]|nr:hypothetical protein L293_4006 [Acinetobacter gyllenbergii CIP 110306 = MTCC 11365]
MAQGLAHEELFRKSVAFLNSPLEHSSRLAHEKYISQERCFA